ncbi:glycine-rich domain-containing protein [Streptomyces sp. NPDC002125]
MTETTAHLVDPRELISPEIREKISTTVRAQHPQITEDRADAGIGQMAAFLTACATSDRPLSPSPEVDDYWHAFLMHTEDYDTWCADRFGKKVHHKPGYLDPEEHGGGKMLRQYAVDTITELGFLVDPDFWPEIELAECSQCHANCSDSPLTPES